MFYFFNKLNKSRLEFIREILEKWFKMHWKWFKCSFKYAKTKMKENELKLKCGTEFVSGSTEQWLIVWYLQWIKEKCTHHEAISIQSPRVFFSPVALTTSRICEGNKESVDPRQFAPQSGESHRAGGRPAAMSGRLTYSSTKQASPNVSFYQPLIS